MTESLLRREQKMKVAARKSKEEERKGHDEEPPATTAQDEDAASFVDSEGREHKGELKIDATCADAEIRYAVDVDIIDNGCRVIDRFIRRICRKDGISAPYTYHGKARGAYKQRLQNSKPSMWSESSSE